MQSPEEPEPANHERVLSSVGPGSTLSTLHTASYEVSWRPSQVLDFTDGEAAFPNKYSQFATRGLR